MNLSEFLDQFDQTLDAGDGNFVVRCPVPDHADSTPSLLVGQSATDGRLLLFCRAGCPTDLVLSSLNLQRSDLFSSTKRPDTRRPVTTTTPDPDGPTLEDTARLALYAQKCREHLNADNELAAEARAYILERWGLDLETASRLGIGLAPQGPWWDDENGPFFSPTYYNVPRVTFPFRGVNGTVVGLQGRALQESKARWAGPMNPEGRAWSRYAVFESGSNLESVIITEGPGDGVACAAAGHDALAIRGSAMVRSERLTSEIATYLSGRRVVIAPDQDDAGSRFAELLADALSAQGLDVYIMEFPDGVNDVSEWRETAASEFSSAFNEAVDRADAWDPTPTVYVPEKMKSTEVAMAAHLREVLRLADGNDGVIFAGGQGWHIWTGKGWKRDGSAMHIRRAAQEMALALETEGFEEFDEAMGDADLEAAARAKISAGQKAQRSNFLSGLIGELKVMTMVDPDELDQHVHLLNCANGVVDLRDGTISEHDPRLLLTKLVDVDYVPDAECPLWENFIEDCHPVEGMPHYLQTLSGYSLCGNPLQIVAIHHGSGANGKSTWVETLTHVLEGVSVHTPFSTFEQKPAGNIPNDLAMLAGQRIAVASEGEANRPLSEAVIKKISGGDTISARWMRGEFFSFQGRFMTHLLTNHAPSWSNSTQSEGLWRRLVMVKWSVHILPQDRDPYLVTKLKAESEGILRWIVDGAVRFHNEGLQTPAAVLNASKDYRDSSDLLGTFIESHLVEERGAKSSAPAMYAAYRDHMLDVQGVRESEVMSARRFYADIRDRGFGTTRGRMGGQIVMIFQGLRLKTADELATDLDEDVNTEATIGNPRLTSSTGLV